MRWTMTGDGRWVILMGIAYHSVWGQNIPPSSNRREVSAGDATGSKHPAQVLYDLVSESGSSPMLGHYIYLTNHALPRRLARWHNWLYSSHMVYIDDTLHCKGAQPGRALQL